MICLYPCFVFYLVKQQFMFVRTYLHEKQYIENDEEMLFHMFLQFFCGEHHLFSKYVLAPSVLCGVRSYARVWAKLRFTSLPNPRRKPQALSLSDQRLCQTIKKKK